MSTVHGQRWRAATPPRAGVPIRAVDLWFRDPAESGTDGLRGAARVTVRGDDPNLRGHFPGLAVYPGVFVIETLCQAMALIVDTPRDPVLRRIDSVRFLAPLLDGDELTLAIVAVPEGSGWRVTATGTNHEGGVTARIRARFDEAGGDDD